jgi:hypothetical protein
MLDEAADAAAEVWRDLAHRFVAIIAKPPVTRATLALVPR